MIEQLGSDGTLKTELATQLERLVIKGHASAVAAAQVASTTSVFAPGESSIAYFRVPGLQEVG